MPSLVRTSDPNAWRVAVRAASFGYLGTRRVGTRGMPWDAVDPMGYRVGSCGVPRGIPRGISRDAAWDTVGYHVGHHGISVGNRMVCREVPSGIPQNTAWDPARSHGMSRGIARATTWYPTGCRVGNHVGYHGIVDNHVGYRGYRVEYGVGSTGFRVDYRGVLRRLPWDVAWDTVGYRVCYHGIPWEAAWYRVDNHVVSRGMPCGIPRGSHAASHAASLETTRLPARYTTGYPVESYGISRGILRDTE